MDAGIVTKFLVTGLALTTIAGCGGTDTKAPAPTPTPVASSGTGSSTGVTDPPATANLPPAPFGLQTSASFALLGWQYTSNEGMPDIYTLAEDKGTLEWSATDTTYRIAVNDLGSGKLVYTFPPSSNNTLAFSIVQANGSIAPVYVTLIPRYAHAGILYWQSADGHRPFVYSQSIFGIPVQPGTLPTTERARFSTGAQPDIALTVDFPARKITGSLTTFFNGPFDTGKLEIGTIGEADLQADGTFVATLTVPGAPRAGELRGRLFGPSADELGVFWNAPVRLDDGTWTEWRTVMVYGSAGG